MRSMGLAPYGEMRPCGSRAGQAQSSVMVSDPERAPREAATSGDDGSAAACGRVDGRLFSLFGGSTLPAPLRRQQVAPMER